MSLKRASRELQKSFKRASRQFVLRLSFFRIKSNEMSFKIFLVRFFLRKDPKKGAFWSQGTSGDIYWISGGVLSFYVSHVH